VSGDTRNTTDLASRISGLSPEKQALLARKLAARASQSAGHADRIEPRGDDSPAPLSHAQELLWLYEQMTPGTAAYNVPMARRVRGPLDIGALQAALDALVERHESLRTRVTEIEGTARQEVLSPSGVSLVVHGLHALDEASRAAEAERLLQAEAARPFDLTSGTIPRAMAIQVGSEEWLLLIVAHHILFDGGSVGILFRELAQFYAAAVSGQRAELAPLPIQSADYAVWQRREMHDERLRPHVRFWREQLAGAPSGIELPTDFARPPGFAGPGARFTTTLSADTRDVVRAFARAEGATAFMVYLSAFQTLLHRYSGQADLVVGSPIAGRSLPETEGMIGYFANTLALRARFDEDPTFAELLDQVRGRVVHAFEHQEVPYEVLVRELRAGLPASEQALFRVMFTSQDPSPAVTRLGTAVLEGLRVDLGTTKFDLSVSATETVEGIRVSVEYRSDLFAASTIARLVEHWQELMLSAARAPHTRTSRLPILPVLQRDEQLVAWNDTEATWPTEATLHGMFAEQVRRRGQAVAVTYGDTQLTYAEIDKRANRLAWRLRARGIEPDCLVAVCMEKSADVVVALLGVLKAGGAYVPMDPSYPDDRIAFMLEDSKASIVLTDQESQPRLSVHGAETMIAAEAWADAADARDDEPPATAVSGNLCYVIYTSGSTGRPKGVLIEHGNVVRLLSNSRFQFQFDEHDVWTLFHSFSFDFSVWEMYGALLYGGRLVVVPKHVAQDSLAYLMLLEEQGVTVLNQVPSAFYALMQEDRGRPASSLALRYVIFGGEALQPALLGDWKKRYPTAKLINMFGITETTVHVTFKEIDTPEIESGASNIGRPIPTLTAYVLDAQLQLVPVGVTGEVCVGGAGVARGYLNRPELTAERFVAHPFRAGERLYRSGDLGRMRLSGEIEYLGRRDAQVKVRGFRIELGEIETALGQYPLVTACVATVYATDATGPRLVAYYVSGGGTVAREALRAWMAARLPEFMVPSAFVELASLPLTSNGKVDRSALPRVAGSGDPGATLVAPRTETEEVIARVWQEVLGVERVGVETSFFDLGGHSLLATRIAGQVTRIFRATLPLRSFFESPTVAGIARTLVERETKAGQTAAIARLYQRVHRMTPHEREELRRRQAESTAGQDSHDR
jgi:amino acid adenylation domain-containing protein